MLLLIHAVCFFFYSRLSGVLDDKGSRHGWSVFYALSVGGLLSFSPSFRTISTLGPSPRSTSEAALSLIKNGPHLSSAEILFVMVISWFLFFLTLTIFRRAPQIPTYTALIGVVSTIFNTFVILFVISFL
jgi:hypothetical protein